MRDIVTKISSLPENEQITIGHSFPTQLLLLILYARCLDIESIRQETLECRQSLLSVHDERGRLGVLTSEFGNLVLAITEAQFQKGERSNGWHDLPLHEMQQKVIESLRHGLASSIAHLSQAKPINFDFE